MKQNKFKILSGFDIQCVKCNYIMYFPLGLSMDMIKSMNCSNCRKQKNVLNDKTEGDKSG